MASNFSQLPFFSILYVNYFCQTSGTAWIDNTGAKQGNDITVMGKNKTR